MVMNPPASAEDGGSIPGLGRSLGGGTENPLQHPCLGHPWTGEPGRLQFVESQKSPWDGKIAGLNLATK